MTPRNGTKFSTRPTFTEVIDTYDISVAAAIVVHLQYFENAWRASRHDGELPNSFHFEAYTDVDGQYRLGQIRVGANHSYRVLAMFLNERSQAYWIYAYKKVKQRQQKDMERSRLIAQQLWNMIKEK